MNAILFLALAVAPAQTPPLSCAKPVADLGRVRGGPAYSQSFELVNRGGVELAIVHVQPSCGCLAPRITGRSLKPGASATIEIQVVTISQPEGDNLWTARVFYRAAGSNSDQLLDLQVKATLVREVSLQPAALRLALKPGRRHSITLTDVRARPMEVTGVATSSKRIGAAAESPWETVAGHGWVRKIDVWVNEECPAGQHQEFLQIFSSDPDYREMRLPVTAVRLDKQRLQVVPSELKLSYPPANPTQDALLLIRDQLGQPVEIEKVEGDDPALVCRFEEGARATAVVRIRISPDATPTRASNLRVRMRAPVGQTMVVPVSLISSK